MSDFSTALHEYMRGNHVMDLGSHAQLADFVAHVPEGSSQNSLNVVLRVAVTYAQADKVALLIGEFGADVAQFSTLHSDRHRGEKIRVNLLDEALSSFYLRPDVDRSDAGRQRLLETVQLLLKHGASAQLNPDPFENPVHIAAQLADPRRALDEKSAGFDWIFAIQPAPAQLKPFPEVWQLLQNHAPDATLAYDAAFAREQARCDVKQGLSSEFRHKAGATADAGYMQTIRRVAHKIAPRWF